MKKRVVIFGLVVVIFLVTAGYGSALTIVNCFDTGGITVHQTPIAQGRVEARELGGSWFSVPGSWSSKDPALFVSDHGIFLKNRRYEVRVNSGGGYYVRETVCPGFTFSCSFMEIVPEECYSANEFYFVRFRATNIIDSDDLKFIVMNSRNLEYVYSPSFKNEALVNFSVSSIGLTRYLAAFRLDDTVTSVFLTHEDCDQRIEQYYTMKNVSCSRACSNDKGCRQSEYCNQSSNRCAGLICGPCQAISDHRCTPKCIDPDACTKANCDNSTDECYYTRKKGCVFNQTCVGLGTVGIVNGSYSYCSEKDIMVPQKRDNQSCVDGFECENDCINRTCRLVIDYGYNVTIAPFRNESGLLNETEPIVLVEQEYEKQARGLFERVSPYLFSLLIAFVIVIIAIFASRSKRSGFGFRRKKTLALGKRLDEKIALENMAKYVGNIEDAMRESKIFTARAEYLKAKDLYRQLSKEGKAKFASKLIEIHDTIEKEK